MSTQQNPREGYETPVVKRLSNGDRVFPDSTKIRRVNLPADLQDTVGEARVNQLIAQARADVLAMVNEMLHNQGGAAYVHHQTLPTTAVVVQHNLGRRAVAVSMYSEDYATQYEFFTVIPRDESSVTISFDDPMAFIAVIT